MQSLKLMGLFPCLLLVLSSAVLLGAPGLTIYYQGGRDFVNAKIKLMAGNVNKLLPRGMRDEAA